MSLMYDENIEPLPFFGLMWLLIKFVLNVSPTLLYFSFMYTYNISVDINVNKISFLLTRILFVQHPLCGFITTDTNFLLY